jgi:capsular polysaccharide transport system ATP-binding protein
MVVGDVRFHERCHQELFHKRKDRAFILVTHEANVIKMYCESAAVLHEGKLLRFPTVDDAYEFYNNTMIIGVPGGNATAAVDRIE